MILLLVIKIKWYNKNEWNIVDNKKDLICIIYDLQIMLYSLLRIVNNCIKYEK